MFFYFVLSFFRVFVFVFKFLPQKIQNCQTMNHRIRSCRAIKVHIAFQKDIWRWTDFNEIHLTGLLPALYDGESSLLYILDHFFQVNHCRFGIQIPHHLIGPRVLYQLPDPALFVHEIPEYKGVDGAGLHAGRDNLPVFYHSLLIFCDPVSDLDPLNAKRAFFHDPFAANRDLRIELKVEGRRPLPVEPVEPSYLIGTVLGAKTGPDAPVVNLIVDPFYRMMRGKHRAYRFTRRIVAMLAQHGKKNNPVRGLVMMVTLHLKPCHLPSVPDAVYSHNSDIVFCIARRGTGCAPDTSIQIDNH